MGKETIRTVDLQSFKNFEKEIDYMDDEFIVVSTMDVNLDNNENSNSQDMVRLGFFLITFCLEGCIQIEVNYKTYRLEAGDVLFGLPYAVIGHALVTPKYKVKVVGLSTQFLSQMNVGKTPWNTGLHLHNNPVKHVDKRKDDPVFRLLRDLIILKMTGELHCYHKEVMRYLFSALFCELMGNLTEEVTRLGKPEELKESAKRVYHIFQRFSEMLSKDEGMHRTVAYYADALCYTPKHFSKIIKQACGRTPMEMINEYAMDRIKYRLRYSEKSIKEIAEEFNFSNQSFFGKYVKAHLGMSPQHFRSTTEK